MFQRNCLGDSLKFGFNDRYSVSVQLFQKFATILDEVNHSSSMCLGKGFKIYFVRLFVLSNLTLRN